MVQEKWQTISLVLNDLYFWPFVAGPIWTGVYVCLYSSTLYGILHVLINIFLDFKDFKQFTSCCNSVLFISFFFSFGELSSPFFRYVHCTPVPGTRLISWKHLFSGGHTSAGVCVLMPGGGRSRSVITLSTIFYLLITDHSYIPAPRTEGLLLSVSLFASVSMTFVIRQYHFNVVWLF